MTGIVPSSSSRALLGEASLRYAEALAGSDADRYLTARGIGRQAQTFFRLGVVADPCQGHEQYRGRLAIPYLTRSGVVTMRFRSVPDADGNYEQPKYRSLPGDPARIYNPAALMRPEDYVCVCEGELDTVTASAVAGLPAIGIPGANNWRPEFARALRWYRNVFVLADTDDKGAGVDFAEKVAKAVRNVAVIPMPQGHDVNSFVNERGAEALRDLIGV